MFNRTDKQAKMWTGRSNARIINQPATQQEAAGALISLPMCCLSLVVYLIILVMKLTATILILKEQNSWLAEQLRRYNRHTYVGKTQACDGQIFMPEVAEWLNETLGLIIGQQSEGEEVVETTTKSRSPRKPRGKSLVNLLNGNFPEEVIEYMPTNCTCPECNRQLVNIGVNERLSLVIIPEQIKIRKERAYTMKCEYCDKYGTEAHVVAAKLPAAVLPGSEASPETIAYLAYQKFLMGSPIYRLEKNFLIQGLPLYRQTMNSWINNASLILLPLVERFKHWLFQEEVLLGDETTVECLKLEGAQKPKKCYVWLVRTSRFSEHPLVSFRFEDNRRYATHRDFIQGFQGYFQSDGYDCYHGLEGIVSVGCFAHARGKFSDAYKDGGSKLFVTYAGRAVMLFDKMFKLEDTFKDLQPEERLKKRLQYVRPVMDQLDTLLKEIESKGIKKSSLGQAAAYTRNQWQYMMNVFMDGRLDLTNNLSERTIKDYVIARKNFLFVIHEKGGVASAVYTSIIATARENGLNPYEYLKWLLEQLSQIESPTSEQLDALMPWCAPETCKVTWSAQLGKVGEESEEDEKMDA